jgi:predicted metal-dependent phosphoesterase TrpH
LIDLHLHTTASDGALSPRDLTARAAAAGLTTFAVTDHDTVAGLAEAHSAAERAGIRLVPGIEITAVADGRDVHVLGYFIDPDSETLAQFLRDQRTDRIRRVKEMAARLDSLGYPVDVNAVLERTRHSHRSVGRPALADALVAAGHVQDRNDAFARLLGRGCPAFVPRAGVGGADVIRVIHDAKGIASVAHPGLLRDDGLIAGFVEAGLDALEVWHSDHTPEQEAHYGQLARQYGLARSGGSDYHGDGLHRACQLGVVTLPPRRFAELSERAEKG